MDSDSDSHSRDDNEDGFSGINPNDFLLNAILGLGEQWEILKIEAACSVIGRGVGAVYAGMVQAGMPEDQARKIVEYALACIVEQLGTTSRPSRGGGEPS